MRIRALSVLALWGALLGAAEARAQAKDPVPWSFTAATSTYLLPDDPDYIQPAFIADREQLHLEARYNYEGRKTASVWVGYNFSFGEKVTFELTPMLGAVFGDTSGVAPGYKTALSWRNLEFSSESELVFDSDDSAEHFFYTWSELSWSPRDWVRVGLVVQRTRVYQTEFDIQRGLLLGFSWKKANFTTYVFNPDAGKPTVVLGLGVDF